MSRIGSRDTKPEIVVRRYLHKNGFRFRLHASGMPGRPDIVLRKFRSVIFVNGCFWHRHPSCGLATTPASNAEFWAEKFRQNVQRDRTNQKKLAELGWDVYIVWECETSDQNLAPLIKLLRAKRQQALRENSRK